MPKQRRHRNHVRVDVATDYNSRPKNLSFSTLDANEISELLDFYDTDANIQAAVNIMLDALLNGGIEFKRKGKRLTDVAKVWYSRVWLKFIRDMVRSLLALGFSACSSIPHPEYGAEPVVVSLDRVDVDFATTPYNQVYLRLFERDSNTGPLDIIYRRTRSEQQEIKNVKVFILNSPTAEGDLRSRIAALREDFEHEKTLSSLTLLAERNRAMPMIVSEFCEDKIDNSVVSAPPITAATMYGDGDGPIDDFYDHDPTTLSNKRSRSNHYRSMRDQLDNQLYLEPNRKLVLQRQAEVPSEFLAFRIARMERVFMTFGIPLSMVSNIGSRGGRNTNGSSGSNSNAHELFLNAQKEWRQLLLGYTKAMYQHIHMDQLLQEYKENGDPSKPLDMDDFNAEANVEISMPSLPNDDILNDLYLKGFITPDAFSSYMGARHGIEEGAFNRTPTISVKELNGISIEPKAAK